MSRLLRSVLTLSILVGGSPAASAGQTTPALGSDGQVGATLSAGLGITWLGSRPLPVLALAGTLRLSPIVEIGGEGVLGLGAIRLSPEGSPDRSELTSGYGGILLRWRPAGDLPGIRLGGSILVGAGTTRIRSPLAVGTIVSDNYFVLEPRLNLLVRQDRSVRFSGSAGYRATLGTETLPGIGVAGLRGPTLTVGVQLVRDP